MVPIFTLARYDLNSVDWAVKFQTNQHYFYIKKRRKGYSINKGFSLEP